MHKVRLPKIILYVATAFVIGGCADDTSYRIHGVLENGSLDGHYIYLVPAEAQDVPDFKDSVMIEGGRFCFEGREERVCLIKPGYDDALMLQALLVVTEPGDIVATCAKVGRVTGTPQNDQMQYWKEVNENLMETRRKYYQRMVETSTHEDSAAFKQVTDSLNAFETDFNYKFILETGRSTLGRFFYKRKRMAVPEDQRHELNAIFVED